LTFYYEPDLCAGSFRNTALVESLSKKLSDGDCLDVFTTYPNRYHTYKQEVPYLEKQGAVTIHRVPVPEHKSGFLDQMLTFKAFFTATRNMVKDRHYDLVFASSARLFTAYLGYTIAKTKKLPLYLDIRDIFVDVMEDMLKNQIAKTAVLPLIRTVERITFDNASHINLLSKGFADYFKKFKCSSYSYYPNGIDEIFLDTETTRKTGRTDKNIQIVYAGNIGEGQGLEKIIPQAAAKLGDTYQFVIIGDGGTKTLLDGDLQKLKITNVEIKKPVSRSELKQYYANADYLFLHLNSYKAFEKVLPSKIFEYAVYDKPIIAGVSGFAREFLREKVENIILFKPCDADDFINNLKSYKYKCERRSSFIDTFKRSAINEKMAQSILRFA